MLSDAFFFFLIFIFSCSSYFSVKTGHIRKNKKTLEIIENPWVFMENKKNHRI